MTDEKNKTPEGASGAPDESEAAAEPRPANDAAAGESAAPGDEHHAAERPRESAEHRIEELEAELAKTKDQALRALAEAENTRRRAEKERQDLTRYGAAGLARDVLAVADNLRRALEAIGEEDRKDQTLDTLATGVEMTEKMLLEALERHGVRRIEPHGEPFDHNFHQAMMEVDTDEVAGGHVAQVMQPGYVLHDRLLRPAMVAVAKKKKGDADGGQPKVDTTA